MVPLQANNAGKQSFMFKIVKILILCKFIPVRVEYCTLETLESTVSFKWISWRTLTSIIFCYGSVLTLYVLNEFVLSSDYKFERTSTDQFAWSSFALVFNLIFPAMPTIIGYSMTKVSTITMNSNLKWPKYGWVTFGSFVSFVASAVLYTIPSIMSDEARSILKISRILTTFTGNWFAHTFLIISSFLVNCWITMLNDTIVKEQNKSLEKSNLGKIRYCLETYSFFFLLCPVQ